MSDVEQWEHDEQRAMETAREKEGGQVMSNLIQDAYEQICGDQREILVLREQVKKLKAELKSIDGALSDPRANLTLTTSEIIWELKEQNEKLRETLQELYELLPVGVGIAAISLPDLATPARNSIPKEPTLPVFDADSPRFRQVFDEAVQEHNLPGKRKGEGYRSPITQWCFEIAYSVVNRLRLYEK